MDRCLCVAAEYGFEMLFPVYIVMIQHTLEAAKL